MTPVPSRERRVNRTMQTFLTTTLLITVIALLVRGLKVRFPSDFLNGMELGLLAALPVGMGVLLYRAYRQLDEYGQRLQERAAGLAFLLSMVATMVGYWVQTLAGVQIPLWTVYVFGLLVYSVSVQLQKRAG